MPFSVLAARVRREDAQGLVRLSRFEDSEISWMT